MNNKPYGNTVAAVKLAEMVEDNPKARSYVGSTLTELNTMLGQLFQVKDTYTKRLLCLMIKQEFEQRLDSSSCLDPKVHSYLLNVVRTTCKIFKRHADKASF